MSLTPHATFWQTLPRPLIGLAPMNSVTDHACRHIHKKYGGPALLFTEFTSVDGLCAGAEVLLRDLLYDESQRPILGQLYGHLPERFRQAAILLCRLGFDGIDLNMGCPSKSIAARGAGAGLIRTPATAQAILAATRQGIRDWQNGADERDCPDVPPALAQAVRARAARLPAAYQARRPVPVSVKTRIGYHTDQVAEWIPRLLEAQPAAITLHGRTLVQGYRGEADWDAIARAADLARGSGTLLLGNGDLASHSQAVQRCTELGLDGALIGRAAYGNPFVFHAARTGDPDGLRLLSIALEHARLYDAHLARQGDRYHFLPMRKHLVWYVRGLPGASHLRRTLVQVTGLAEAERALTGYLAYRCAWPRPATPRKA